MEIMVYQFLYKISYGDQCQRIYIRVGPSPMAPPPIGPLGGVTQVIATTPFHGLVQYHAFMNNQGVHTK
jgi:hypothetical protein